MKLNATNDIITLHTALDNIADCLTPIMRHKAEHRKHGRAAKDAHETVG